MVVIILVSEDIAIVYHKESSINETNYLLK